MMWYSDRAGYRSHGSWGAEADVYIMFFDLDAYERFRMNKEELALIDESKKKRMIKRKKTRRPARKKTIKKTQRKMKRKKKSNLWFSTSKTVETELSA